jgi:hypothetical protein
MSKLSVKPDTNPVTSLRPTSFPVPDLSFFQVSGSSAATFPKVSVFPDQQTVRFNSTTTKLPNVFQYNDRAKLMLSSD